MQRSDYLGMWMTRVQLRILVRRLMSSKSTHIDHPGQANAPIVHYAICKRERAHALLARRSPMERHKHPDSHATAALGFAELLVHRSTAVGEIKDDKKDRSDEASRGKLYYDVKRS